MNLLDYVLIGVVAISVLAAAAKGFVYEMWMMAAAAVAVGVAAWQFGAVAAWLESVPLLGSEEIRNFVAFALIVVVVLVAAAVSGRLLRGAVRAVGLGWPDRLMGAGLGLVRGALLGVALVAMLTAFPFRPSWVEDSTLAPGFLWGSKVLAAVMPDDLAERFRRGLAKVGAAGGEMP